MDKTKIRDKELECQDMADVCELAHERTLRKCRRLGIVHTVTFTGGETRYTRKAQEIFDRIYDAIIERTGL